MSEERPAPGTRVRWADSEFVVVGPHEIHRGLTVIRDPLTGEEFAPLTYNLRPPSKGSSNAD